MRSSWGGAMGLTQFLPSEFYKYGVDFDGDGRVDIWTRCRMRSPRPPKQLVGKGWQRGKRWAYEVRAPPNVDCTIGDPDSKMPPIGEWLKRGLRAGLRPQAAARAELAEPASLLLPAGTLRPGLPRLPKNYFVIKEYNFSDLYVLFVGHLGDRIADPRPFETPWSQVVQLRTADVEAHAEAAHRARPLRRQDRRQGRHEDARSRSAPIRRRTACTLDCWPTAARARPHARQRVAVALRVMRDVRGQSRLARSLHQRSHVPRSIAPLRSQ